jgi:SPP1 family predicted phage head-tail adaptor
MPLRRLSAGLPRAGMYVTPGAMNRMITFCSPGSRNTDGSSGQPSAQFNSWAALYALAGDELDKAQQIAQRVSHLAVITYQLNVEEDMTIQFNEAGQTRVFQIAAIEDIDELHWQLKIYCFEINQNAGGAS